MTKRVIAVVRAKKPVADMTDAELDAFADELAAWSTQRLPSDEPTRSMMSTKSESATDASA